MWWHLRAGKEMVEQGKILTTDIFSYTHYGEKWTNAFWLSDVVLYLTYRLGGYLGITLLTSLIAVVLMAVIYKQTLQNPFPLPLLIILLATFAVTPIWTPRPQIFSLLLLAILDYGLSGQYGFILRRPWLMVPIFVLWANMHGGFIWGFLLMIALIVGNGIDTLLKRENDISFKRLSHLGVWALIAAFAISINPNGLSLWKLPFYTVGVSIESITEWGSPDFHRLDLQPILWLIFLIIVGAGASGKKLSWSDILKTIGFSYMAFISQRSIGPFVVVVTPIVLNSLRQVWSEGLSLLSQQIARFYKQKQSKPIPVAFATILNIFIIGMLIHVTTMRASSVSTIQQVHNGLPMNAVKWIRENQPEGQMFNAYNWGGYLQWELPEYPVFIDGRADLYGEKTMGDWWRVVNATDEALELLDLWQVKFVILEPGWPILEKLLHNGWRILYEDKTAIIVGR